MLFVYGEQQIIFFIISIFILIKSNETQTIEKAFRSSNVELIPKIVILNSTSIVNFSCINHQSDGLPLIYSLSKNISKSHLKKSHYRLNKTTIHIRIQLENYLGIFQLFCYVKNKKAQGTRADVIVKTEPNDIQLTDRCHVYDKQYIKCIFQAPTLARAIQNDFPPDFESIEITNLQAYYIQYEFLKNESTNEYLVFKWIPSVNGEFPNGILMNMSITLPYINTVFYRFDMTPTFAIKPDFTLKNLSESQIEMKLKSTSPSIICEISTTPKTNSNIIQTSRMIKSTQDIIIIDNLLYNTIYQICIKCGQTVNDPYGIEKCQETRTSNQFFLTYGIIAIAIISCLVLLVIIGLIYRNKQVADRAQPVSDEPVDDDIINDIDQEKYSSVGPTDLIPVPESRITDSKYKRLFPKPL